jgi:hypothetical protein
LTEIEEKDFREDDVVFFVPLKRVFAVDATFVVVVTANIVLWFLKGFGLRKGLTRRGVINMRNNGDKIPISHVIIFWARFLKELKLTKVKLFAPRRYRFCRCCYYYYYYNYRYAYTISL